MEKDVKIPRSDRETSNIYIILLNEVAKYQDFAKLIGDMNVSNMVNEGLTSLCIWLQMKISLKKSLKNIEIKLNHQAQRNQQPKKMNFQCNYLYLLLCNPT